MPHASFVFVFLRNQQESQPETPLAARLGVSTDWLLGLDNKKDAPPAACSLPDKIAETRDPGTVYCPACGQKDRKIASQAEPIVNLTRPIASLAGKGRREGV